MRVAVTFLGILRDQVGQKTLQIELPDGAGFGDLMDALAPTMDQKVGAWAWDSDTRRFSPRVVVSRQKAVGGVDEARPLEDGEEILVFPPLAGG
jgi:molybdopterin converting factor small subunit